MEHYATVWGHLEDLRRTLLKSLVIVSLGFLVLLGNYQPLLRFLTNFASAELIEHQVQRIQVVNQSTDDQLIKLPPHAWITSDLTSIKHEEEVYYRLEPRQSLFYDESIGSSLLILGPIEGVALVFKVCFWLSVALTAPVWGWIWLQFIFPGLKQSEKRIVIPFLLCSMICLSMGLLFAHYVSLPLSNRYLLAFNQSIGHNAWTLVHYINYVLFLCLGHAIAAELTLLLFLLVHFRFLLPDRLISIRRYMIVVAFILGALLTPPDVFTQLLLALPLIGLYEIAIGYAKWRNRAVI